MSVQSNLIINDTKSNCVAFTSKKMRLEQNLFDCFANDFEKLFKTIANKETCNFFSYHQPLFSFLPACVDTRKINLGVGVLVQDSIIVMTLNLSGWHLQVRICVWNRIFLIVRNENWKKRKKSSRTNTHPIYFFLRQQSFWPRVKLFFWGGCTSTGPNDCNDTKSNWVAFASKKMRLEQNLFDCAQWELKKQ